MGGGSKPVQQEDRLTRDVNLPAIQSPVLNLDPVLLYTLVHLERLDPGFKLRCDLCPMINERIDDQLDREDGKQIERERWMDVAHFRGDPAL